MEIIFEARGHSQSFPLCSNFKLTKLLFMCKLYAYFLLKKLGLQSSNYIQVYEHRLKYAHGGDVSAVDDFLSNGIPTPQYQ